MTLQLAASQTAQAAYALVQELQAQLVAKLDALPPQASMTRFQPVHWLRAQGQCGGGTRFVANDPAVFNRASVNISQVQYEKDSSKKMGSASALSTIVHPRHPLAPSLHMHISWTEMKSGHGYWRIMGDLNPSIPVEQDRLDFEAALAAVTGSLYAQGKEQGEKYFYIPALGRHRGVAHFYLEEYATADRAADFALARAFGQKLVDTYAGLVSRALQDAVPMTAAEAAQQLAYHTLYFLQVLTLDRGTTSGLLVHDENDTGILGSLPSHVDRRLLESWISRHPPLQQELIHALLGALPAGSPSLVDDGVKVKIAAIARDFYRRHPTAQDLLAKGHSLPPTVDNHR